MTKFYHLALIFSSALLFSQDRDSVQIISQVEIDSYKKPTTFIASTKSVSLVSKNLMTQNTPERMLESVNHIAGARMEERSPGSYRISLRGSTLRSPFGVRNVKVYVDDFILSDASGNTYLNIISPALIDRMEIYKGPESGDYGAMTGGTILLKTRDYETSSVGISVGSYGTFDQNLVLTKRSGRHFIEIFQNYYQTDSYREQSRMNRKQIFIKDNYNYSKKAVLKTMLMYSDLDYQTPGGLTLEQMNMNRRQARPATATISGAVEQDAGIMNKMLLAGVSNEFSLSKNISHFILFQGSYVDFENPFITNYEHRYENNLALRTHINYENNWRKISLAYRLGFEGGRNQMVIRNFDNDPGTEGNPQNFDQLKNLSGFYFLSQRLNVGKQLFTDISISLNSNDYNWQRTFPNVENGQKAFRNQWLPNFGMSYILSEGFSVRGKLGKGNSAPTNEEVRSSDQQFNSQLQPEYGWNREVGLRKQFGRSVFLEAGYFDFRMKDAIVRRQNDAGQEYFVNAGETVQKGLELLLETKEIDLKNQIINNLRFRVSGSFYNFKFENYRQNSNDFSGNKLTGVPRTTVNSLLSLTFFKTFALDYSHFYTSRLPLNDANSVWSDSSLVGNLQLRLPIDIDATKVYLNLQIQNIYNTYYVSGFDINAFGNRYYNPAAQRNFIFGVQARF